MDYMISGLVKIVSILLNKKVVWVYITMEATAFCVLMEQKYINSKQKSKSILIIFGKYS